jgi:hypothetical protein
MIAGVPSLEDRSGPALQPFRRSVVFDVFRAYGGVGSEVVVEPRVGAEVSYRGHSPSVRAQGTTVDPTPVRGRAMPQSHSNVDLPREPQPGTVVASTFHTFASIHLCKG